MFETVVIQKLFKLVLLMKYINNDALFAFLDFSYFIGNL